MASFKEVDDTAVNGSDKEPLTQEEALEEQTPERRHVVALLDISEEDFMKELEPYEYHCYSGWEEAVHGWARVAPLSCILLTQKTCKISKQKEAEPSTPSSVDPTVPDADSSASIAEHRCNSSKTSMPSDQHARSCGSTGVAALQKNVSEWPVPIAMQKTTSNLPLKEKIEEEKLRETPSQPHHPPSKYSENRPTKPQKHRHRPDNIAVPIKNFTFLPPIESPHLNPKKVSGQLCSGKKAPERETTEENGFMFNRRSGTRGTRVNPITNPELPTYSVGLTPKYWTCQQNPHVFSAVRVSVPKRYQVPMSSRPDTVQRTSYSVSKSLRQALHSSTAAGPPAHTYPSKTMCM